MSPADHGWVGWTAYEVGEVAQHALDLVASGAEVSEELAARWSAFFERKAELLDHIAGSRFAADPDEARALAVEAREQARRWSP